jgi:hypothetical protein
VFPADAGRGSPVTFVARVGWVAAFLAGVLVASFLLGPGLALPTALAIVAAAFVARRSGALQGGRQLSRWRAAASAGLMVGLGVFFAKVLVANPSDNAYLGIALLGLLLAAVGVPFGLAAVAPAGSIRAILAQIGIALVWTVGGPGVLLLLVGGPIYLLSSRGGPPGGFVDNRVAINHLLGCVALVPVLWLVGYHWPRQGRTPSAG